MGIWPPLPETSYEQGCVFADPNRQAQLSAGALPVARGVRCHGTHNQIA